MGCAEAEGSGDGGKESHAYSLCCVDQAGSANSPSCRSGVMSVALLVLFPKNNL